MKTDKKLFIKTGEKLAKEIDAELMKEMFESTKQRQLKNIKLKRGDPDLGKLFVG